MANLSPPGRLSYPHLYVPCEPMEGSKSAPSFQATLLFPKEMTEENAKLFSQMKKVAAEAAKKKWGDKVPKGLRSPFRCGDERNDEKDGTCPEYVGHWFVCFKTSWDEKKPHLKPTIVDQKGRPITQESGIIYPGCWVRVSYGAYGYENSGNKGVSLSLNNLQFLRDDKSFDTRTTAQQDFGCAEQSDFDNSNEDLF